MDAKSRADFINSVVKEGKTSSATPAFEPAGSGEHKDTDSELKNKEQVTSQNNAFNFIETEVEIDEDSVSVFAEGLPSWDIVPPLVVVRRKRKK